MNNKMLKWVALGMPKELCSCMHEMADHTLKGDCIHCTCHHLQTSPQSLVGPSESLIPDLKVIAI